MAPGHIAKCIFVLNSFIFTTQDSPILVVHEEFSVCLNTNCKKQKHPPSQIEIGAQFESKDSIYNKNTVFGGVEGLFYIKRTPLFLIGRLIYVFDERAIVTCFSPSRCVVCPISAPVWVPFRAILVIIILRSEGISFGIPSVVPAEQQSPGISSSLT